VPRSDSGRDATTVAQRHGGGDLLESRCWCSSFPVVRTTPAAVCGRGFPSLSKEGNFSVEFHDRN